MTAVAAVATTGSNFAGAMKSLYRHVRVEDMTYERRPMMALLPKFEGFVGKDMPVPIKYGNPQGVSPTFSVAQTNRTQLLVDAFTLTRTSIHSVASIEGEVQESSEADAGAFLSALAGAIDGAMEALSDTIETYIPRNGTASMATVGSESTTTLTLAVTSDHVNFEVGMVLQAGANEAQALRDSGNVAEVTGVNRRTGVLTSNANWTTSISGLAAGDHLYREGATSGEAPGTTVMGAAWSGGAESTADLGVPTGFSGWIPESGGFMEAVSGEAFFGVDRSVDVTRLSGNIYDGSADPVEEALIQGQSIAAGEGGAIDTLFINHAKYRELILELGSRARYERRLAQNDAGDIARIGFQSVVVDGDRGPIDVVSANKQRRTICHGLEMDTWLYATLKKPVRINDRDGNKLLREGTADNDEIRIVSRGNICCSAPGRNVAVTLSA
jgi:hypothetical protein